MQGTKCAGKSTFGAFDAGAPHADERLPRYTSYPTAPHFNAKIGADTYTSWLRALAAGTTTSLYCTCPLPLDVLVLRVS